jgi:4-amino-4-deoxy-L-arabinose transferase-like glycosyltransferase
MRSPTLPKAKPAATVPALARRALPGFCAAGALVVLATLYFALTAAGGIISTNDGSHYALTKALAADGTVRIDPYVNYGAIQPRRGTPTPDDYRDVSFRDGHFYSDRPPGTAFLAVPFYWLGLLVDRISGRQDLDFPLRYVTMLPPLLGAATALATALLARGLGTGWPAAVATAATGALTTLALKYATLLYSHIAAAACVTGALAALLLAERRPGRARPLALGGLLLGYGAVVEYPNLLLIAPVGLYVLWQARGAGSGAFDWRGTVAFFTAWAVPIAVLAGYNWLAFGRPWHTSYTYQYYFDWSRSPLTTYVTPPLTGLRWLLAGPSGLFVVTPAFLLALWGLAILARRSPARALLLLGVVLAVLIPTAMHRTYYGGGSRDTRYLLAIVPALYAPLAVWFEAVVRSRRPALRLTLLAGALALCTWGLARSYLSLLTMFGHRAVERTPAEAWDIVRAGWRDPAVVAPGLALIHYFIVLAVPLGGVLWAGWAIWSEVERSKVEGPSIAAD